MKAIRKDFVREIRHTFSRFLSILILVALAVAFLSGLRSTAPDMKNTCDTYLDEQSFMDIQILGTLGLTQEDMDILRAQPGVAAAEPAYMIDAYAHDGALDVVTKLYSLPKQLNQLTVLEGRLPKAANECVVDSLLSNRMGLKLGATLEFQTSGDFKDALLPESFEVVGIVRSPLYISPERGTSSLGTGQVSAFAYVPEEAFDLDFYTSAFLTVEGASQLQAFSPEYSDRVDEMLDQLKPIGQERSRLRRESLVNEGNEQLADAEQELSEAKAEAEEKLSDAWTELSDARKQLDDGWAELRQAQQDLKTETADAKQKLADAEVELADAKEELEDGEQKYADGLEEFRDGEAEYNDGWAEYSKNADKIEDARAQYEDGYDQYLDGKSELNEARKQLDAGEEQYQAGLEAFDHSLDGFLPPDSGFTTASQLLEALNKEGTSGPIHRMLNQKILTAKAGILVLSAKAEELERKQARAEELEAEIADLEAQLEALPTNLALESVFYAEAPDAGSGTPLPGLPNGWPGLPDVQWPDFPWFPDRPENPDPENPNPGPENPDTPDPDQPGGPDFDRIRLEAQLARKQQELNRVQQDITDIQTETGMKTPEELRGAVKQLEALPNSATALQSQLAMGHAQLMEARSELDVGWAKYESGRDALRDAKAQLDDAEEQLLDGEAQLADAKEQLDDAKKQLDDARQDLTDARNDLDDGWQKYRDGQIELADGHAELTTQVQDANVRIADAKRDLNDGEAEYADGLAQYNDAKADAEEQIADAEDQLGDARRKIADIGDSEWYILDRDSNPGYLGFGQDADRMANLASVFPILFFLVAALVCLTTMTRMVEEQRVQIGCLKALGYSRWAISRKYLGYGFLPALLGGILGLAIGFTLFPKMIFTAYQIMYDVPDIQLSVYPGISAVSLLAAVGCTTISSAAACMNALRETPAALMRPRAPKAGKRVLLEYIKPLWSRMSFNRKVTARNLLRYQKRFWMTVIGIGGCTALIIAGFGLRSSLLDTMHIQYDEIFQYTAQVAVSENLLDSERADIEAYIDSNSDIVDTLSCRIGSVTAESDTYNTSAYMEVVDPARVGDFVNLRTYRGQEPLTVPDDGVIIDQKLSELLDIGPGDTFILDADSRVEVRVAAVNDNYLAHFIYLSPAYYEEVFGEKLLNNAYLMTFTDSDLALCDSIFTDLMDLHGVVAASRMLSTRDTYMSAMERIDFVVVIVILSAAALALVVLYNLSNINITERRRELATIRVLGFYDREVSNYVNRENTVLTVFGILFGIAAGSVLHSWLVRSVEIDLMMFGRQTDPMAYLWAAVLTTLFSAVVAFLSHQKMKRIDMVESLKSAE